MIDGLKMLTEDDVKIEFLESANNGMCYIAMVEYSISYDKIEYKMYSVKTVVKIPNFRTRRRIIVDNIPYNEYIGDNYDNVKCRYDNMAKTLFENSRIAYDGVETIDQNAFVSKICLDACVKKINRTTAKLYFQNMNISFLNIDVNKKLPTQLDMTILINGNQETISIMNVSKIKKHGASRARSNSFYIIDKKVHKSIIYCMLYAIKEIYGYGLYAYDLDRCDLKSINDILNEYNIEYGDDIFIDIKSKYEYIINMIDTHINDNTDEMVYQ